MKSLKYITYEVTSTSVPFQSKHTGSLNIQAVCNNISSSSVQIEDMNYYNGATSSNNKTDWTTYNGALTLTDSTGTKVYSNTMSEAFYYWNHLFDKDDDFEIEFTYVTCYKYFQFEIRKSALATTDMIEYCPTSNPVGWYIYSDNCQNSIFNRFSNCSGGRADNITSSSVSDNSVMKFVRDGTSLKLYVNGTLIHTESITINDDFYIGFGGHSAEGRYGVFKDFKVL